MSELILRDLSDGILRITLNDPSTRNSLSRKMIEELQASLRAAQARVIILAANGPAFSSGHNLKEITAHRSDADEGRGFFKDLFDECAELMLTITNSPCPVIAEVDGLASAAGCQLVASCDLAIATDRSTFCTPGVNIGLFCSTPMVAVSRKIGRKPMMEMLLLGEPVDAREAQRLGLVNRCVADGVLDRTVAEMAKKLAGKSALTLRIGKEAFYRQLDMGLETAYAYCSEVMTRNMMAEDAAEGIDAFLEKRPPAWRDR